MRSPILALLMVSAWAVAAAADKAPDFTLPDVNGGKFKLQEALKSGPVLVNFWATWCKPCLQELPMLDRIHQVYSPRGLQVVAVSVDNPRSASKVKPFTKGSGFKFTVLMDIDSEVRKTFGGNSMPFSALIAPSGEIVYQHLGYVPGDEKQLEEAVVKLLDSLQPATEPRGTDAQP